RGVAGRGGRGATHRAPGPDDRRDAGVDRLHDGPRQGPQAQGRTRHPASSDAPAGGGTAGRAAAGDGRTGGGAARPVRLAAGVVATRKGGVVGGGGGDAQGGEEETWVREGPAEEVPARVSGALTRPAHR